jgi:hypothetical protein
VKAPSVPLPLPHVELCGFSVRNDGAVACLRRDTDERAIVAGDSVDWMPHRLIIIPAFMRHVTSAEHVLGRPVWSPDCQFLAFTIGGLWKTAVDGTALFRLSERTVVSPQSGRGAARDTKRFLEKNAYVT